MSKKSNHRLTHGSRTRRVLRAAVTIGTVTTICCGTNPFTAQAAITSGPEVEALKQLKMDYVANVDLNNWPALYQQFTPNALIDASDSLPGGLGPVFPGRDLFTAFNALVLGPLSTHHEGYDPVITVADDGTTATGVWQMNDRLTDPFNIIGLRGHGVYTDSYVKNGDTWVVDKSTLVYHQQYIEILPGILNLKIYIKDDGTPYPVVAPATTSTTSLVSTQVDTAVDAAPASLATAPLSRATPLTLNAKDVNDLSPDRAVGVDVTSTNSLASEPSGPVDEPSGGETADRGSQPEKTTTATDAGGDTGLAHVTSDGTHDNSIDTEENSTTAVKPSIDAVRKDDSEVRKPVQPGTVQAKSTTAQETSGAEPNNPTSVSKTTADTNKGSGDNSDGSGNSD